MHLHTHTSQLQMGRLALSSLFLTMTCMSIFITACNGDQEAEVKGMFVFGSSHVDNGNNNFLKNSTARADYLPYGIDFPFGVSGRFSNGRNFIDVLTELLKLPSFIPPFADPSTRGDRIVHGVNYASGGSGILNQTGSIAGEVTSLSQQVSNFERTTMLELRAKLGEGQKLSGHLSKCLFVVGTGGNDYLLNYFAPTTSTKRKPTLTRFTRVLISRLSKQLKRLHRLGARKFVLFSIQPMGCAPVVRTRLHLSNGTCVEPLNMAAILFNSHLLSLVRDMKVHMPGSSAVYVDSYKIIRDIIDDPIRHGFLDASKACCELPATASGILCLRGGRACGERAVQVFFDGLHPTDAVNVKIASAAYGSAQESEVYPINVKQLAEL